MGTANPVLVQIQTLAGTQGPDALFAEVEKAIATRNKSAKGVAHVAVKRQVLPNNVKGMQWVLAVAATVARRHSATMVRLGVHGGAVAYCGTKAAVEATLAALQATQSLCGTLVSTAYNPATHGNRVSFANAFLCGCPAGLKVAAKIEPTLDYGIGYLFSFPVPNGNNVAYLLGQNAAITATAPKATAPKTTAPKATAPKATTEPENAAEIAEILIAADNAA